MEHDEIYIKLYIYLVLSGVDDTSLSGVRAVFVLAGVVMQCRLLCLVVVVVCCFHIEPPFAPNDVSAPDTAP